MVFWYILDLELTMTHLEQMISDRLDAVVLERKYQHKVNRGSEANEENGTSGRLEDSRT